MYKDVNEVQVKQVRHSYVKKQYNLKTKVEVKLNNQSRVTEVQLEN
jgi:hypothetical protein